MSNLNKVQIIGRLGNDPEVRYTANQKAVASLSVAVGEKWKDQHGQVQERTEWFNVSMFGRLGEIAGEYLRKGSLVYIEGKQRTDKWQDQSGQDRYTTKLIADQMQMLGGRGDSQQQPSQGGYQQQRPAGNGQNRPTSQPQQNTQQGGMAEPDFDILDEDLPF